MSLAGALAPIAPPGYIPDCQMHHNFRNIMPLWCMKMVALQLSGSVWHSGEVLLFPQNGINENSLDSNAHIYSFWVIYWETIKTEIWLCIGTSANSLPFVMIRKVCHYSSMQIYPGHLQFTSTIAKAASVLLGWTDMVASSFLSLQLITGDVSLILSAAQNAVTSKSRLEEYQNC